MLGSGRPADHNASVTDMDRNQLRELMDACRPDSADLAQPEMADVRAELNRHERLRQQADHAEQFDRRVAAAMQGVDVPAGARERLLAVLAAAATAEAPVAARPPMEQRRATRRRLPAYLFAAVASTAAVVMAMASYRWFFGGDDWAPLAIADAAVHRLEADFDPRQPRLWSQAKPARADYPLSRHLIQRVNPPQCTVADVAGCSGVAYLLRSPQGAAAALLVLKPRSTLTAFPPKPPRSPQVNTAGCAAASWSENGRLYVLVVAGSAKHYGSFLRGPRLVAYSQPPAPHPASGTLSPQ